MRTLLTGVLTLLLASPSWAAITCTGTSFPFNTPTDPQAQDYTVPSVSNGITLVHFAMRNSARSLAETPTIGGNNLTQIGTTISSTDQAGELWYRLNVTSGVNSISANFDATPLSYVMTAVTCEDVNQSSPIAVSNSATGAGGGTLTVNCAGTSSGQVVIGFGAVDGTGATLTDGAGQTSLDTDIADNALRTAASTEPGGGTITMSYTTGGGDWHIFCVALEAIAASRNRGGNSIYP